MNAINCLESIPQKNREDTFNRYNEDIYLQFV